jgi:hypothetical protein
VIGQFPEFSGFFHPHARAREEAISEVKFSQEFSLKKELFGVRL